jgi:hypothetical protein
MSRDAGREMHPLAGCPCKGVCIEEEHALAFQGCDNGLGNCGRMAAVDGRLRIFI